MMRRTSNPARHRLIAVLLAALLAFAAGCASNNVPAEDTPDTMDSEFSDGSDATPVVPESTGQDTRISAAEIRIANIYFDFDKSGIRSEFRNPLSAGAGSIKDARATVVIAGHTDEQGSEEYNLALGERRAGAVRKYLYNLGVPMGQMSIVSYGEARPAVSGRGEGAWRLNRRAEFKLR